MWACRAGVATPAEGADVEEAALGHRASGIVKVVKSGSTALVHDGPAFFVYVIG